MCSKDLRGGWKEERMENEKKKKKKKKKKGWGVEGSEVGEVGGGLGGSSLDCNLGVPSLRTYAFTIEP